MALTRLRPYQAEPARAILASVLRGLGLTFVVEMSRQAGKNELSAWLETALLTRAGRSGGSGVKAAPTFTPQVKYSIDRLGRSLDGAGYVGSWRLIDGYVIRLMNARWLFYSAEPTASVVGGTASLLLEVDEAQDVTREKFDRDFRPMAAAYNATTVMYGTAWEETSLLEEALASNRELERRDGVRRNFVYPWQHCARYNVAYGRYVHAERLRLGETHPLFTTQYELRPLPGGGRLLSPADLDLMRGEHVREAGGVAGATYVAGLDVAGEAAPDEMAARGRDWTALTVGRLSRSASRDLPAVQVVAAYRWQSVAWEALYPQLVALLDGVWRVGRVAVDATAIGEAAAVLLSRSLGRSRVMAYRYTQRSKSSLGYGLQAAAASNRLKVYADDGSSEWRAMWDELRLCRAGYSRSRVLSWEVDPRDGHDDLVNAVALLVAAAGERSLGTARGRRQ